MKFKTIKTLTEILKLSYEEMTYEERVKLRWDYIEKHKDEEHWDYIEYWEHHSKRKSDPELLFFKETCVSTLGRALRYDKDTGKFEIDSGIKLGAYLGKVLREDDVKYQIYIHRAVCSTFLPNLRVDNKLTYSDFDVNHIDLDKRNNPLSNLEWLTSSENQNHSKINNNIRCNKGTILKLVCHLPGKFFKNVWFLERQSKAKELGFNPVAISLVAVNNERHKGCTWEYIEPCDGVVFGIPEDALNFIMASKTNIGNAKPVVGTIDIPGEHYQEEFVLVGTEDARRYGFIQGNISNVCSGKRLRANGCKWRYIDSTEIPNYQMGPTEEQLKVLFKN